MTKQQIKERINFLRFIIDESNGRDSEEIREACDERSGLYKQLERIEEQEKDKR